MKIELSSYTEEDLRQLRQCLLGSLMGAVVYDLKTPLAVALTSLEHLERGLQDEGMEPEGAVQLDSLRGMSFDALEAVRHLNEVLESVRVFSELKGHPRIDQIDKAVSTALMLLAGELKYRVSVSRVRGELPAVSFHEGALAQVMAHILRGAMKALPLEHYRENRLHIETWSRAKKVGIDVRLGGVKMVPGDFVMEHQSLCEHILRSYHGSLDVFHDTQQHEVLVRVSLLEQFTSLPTVPPRDLARPRLLIIDGDPGVCRALGRFLGLRFDVTALENGAPACALLLAGQDFDVILCDLYLQDMGGLEVFWWISRERPELVKRFFFSTAGNPSVSTRASLKESGRRVFNKPLCPEKLQVCLEDFVKSGQGA